MAKTARSAGLAGQKRPSVFKFEGSFGSINGIMIMITKMIRRRITGKGRELALLWHVPGDASPLHDGLW